MRVESGLQSIQMLQAQQAFRARRSTESDTAASVTGLPQFDVQNLDEAPLPTAAKPKLPYADIQNIAARAGYVGLSESAIQRAYVTGQSLLTDHRA